MIENIKVIAFDADDTLWVNELFFQETEKAFRQLLQEFVTSKKISACLFQTEMEDLELYRYGAYAPFHTVWLYEKINENINHPRIFVQKSLLQLKNILL